MGTTATPNPTEKLKVQDSFFDLESMDTVTVFKEFDFAPAMTAHEANARVGNDTAKLLEVINIGLKALEYNRTREDASISWKIKDENGNVSDFTGTPADDKAVNALVLTMAKASFGYLNAKDADEKRASKEKALAFIKSQPVLIEGMKAQLAASGAIAQ